MRSPIKLRDGLQRYHSHVSILKKGYVQESYRIANLIRAPFADKLMHKIGSPDIADYRDSRLSEINPRTNKPLSASTVRLEMALLSNVFEVARIEWGVVDKNPVTDVRKPKAPPGRDRRLMAREERKILRYCSAHPTSELYSIVVLALHTAMRQGEILSLRWENINLRIGVAHLPETKNGSKRDVPLNIRARGALTRIGVEHSGKVFSYTSNGLKSAWRIMCKRLNLNDLHFHDLRHEATSKLFELGTLDLMEVAAITGHKSLSMLKRYTHLRAADLVKKLDSGKGRGQLLITKNLVPYPALVEEHESGFLIRILDFENLVAKADTLDAAVRRAQDALLRKLMLALRDKGTVTPPDQYLCPVDEAKIIMIDPLKSEDMAGAI